MSTTPETLAGPLATITTLAAHEWTVQATTGPALLAPLLLALGARDITPGTPLAERRAAHRAARQRLADLGLTVRDLGTWLKAQPAVAPARFAAWAPEGLRTPVYLTTTHLLELGTLLVAVDEGDWDTTPELTPVRDLAWRAAQQACTLYERLVVTT